MRGFEPRLGLKILNLRGYSLIGKTAILHIVILGSSPNISTWEVKKLKSLNRLMSFYIRNKSTM